jgi:hypothetical protein
MRPPIEIEITAREAELLFEMIDTRLATMVVVDRDEHIVAHDLARLKETLLPHYRPVRRTLKPREPSNVVRLAPGLAQAVDDQEGPRRIDRAAFAKDWLDGMSGDDLARRYGISRPHVFNLRAKMNLPTRSQIPLRGPRHA